MNKNNINIPQLILLFVYFISGFCSLVYEVIWRRLLKLTIGNTTYASSITIAVYMAGLAIGAYLIRKKADKIKNKLLVYGGIELLITLFSLAVPLILKVLDSMYTGLYQLTAWPMGLLFIAQILFSSLVILMPAILMGTTLPLLTGWMTINKENTGFKSGLLYSLNTLGAFSGTWISGFYLIRAAGVMQTAFIAAFFNLLVALAPVILFFYLKKTTGTSILQSKSITPKEKRDNKEKNKKKIKSGSIARTPLLILIFLTGFISLGYEIIWLRTIVHFLRAEIYVFSAVLCVYLAGYSVGVYLSAWFVKKSNNYRGLFQIILILIGFCGLFYIPALGNAGLFGSVIFKGLPQFLLQFDSYFLHLFYSLLLFFIPSLLMGLAFPLLIQLWREKQASASQTIATAYSINTIGCVLGTLSSGFVLIPLIGSQGSSQLLGMSAVIAGLYLLVQQKGIRKKISSLAIGALALLTVFLLPADSYLQWVNVCEGRGQRPTKLIDAYEGINTTASVHQYLDNNTKVISTAGINVAGDSMELRQTQKVQGHIPVILHGQPQKVVTVGFGSGELSRLLTLHDIPDISVVEIAPEMVKLAKRNFSHINLGNDLEKKVNVIYMDAKNYFHLTAKKYDIIMNDSIWPGAFAESSSLYTKEYFIDCKKALNDNGIYSAWAPINMPTLTLKSIIKTFNAVFENTMLFYPHYPPSKHLLLVGQKKSHQYNYSLMKKQFAKAEVAKSLAKINVFSVNHIIDYIIADYQSIDSLTNAYPLNTDNHPVVEFDLGRSKMNLDANFTWKQFALLYNHMTPVDIKTVFDFTDLEPADKREIINHLTLLQEANQHYLACFVPEIAAARQLEHLEKALSLVPDNPDYKGFKRILMNSH